MEDRNRSLPAILGKSIDYDLYFGEDSRLTVIFIHGFKGFKDWGAWDLVAKKFAANNFNFIKANLSHNGVDLHRDPYEITDLTAFANNNFSIELDDISRLVTEAQRLFGDQKISMIGHSRGGTLSILATSHDPRINAVVSWAAPSDFGSYFFPEHIPQWEEEGVYTVKNNRNNQYLPIRYQLYQDYILNRDRLYVPDQVKKITQPFLALHGDNDETVSCSALETMKNCPHIQSRIIAGAGHSFGTKHPWDEPQLPKHLDEVVTLSLDFLKQLI